MPRTHRTTDPLSTVNALPPAPSLLSEPESWPPDQLAGLARHEISAAWGSMDADAYAALVADVEARGLADPYVIIYEGAVLDAWHRLGAARGAGRLGELRVRLFTGTRAEAVAYTCSTNAARRHQTAEARARVVLSLYREQWAPRGRPTENAPNGGFSVTEDELARLAGTSIRTIQRVKHQMKPLEPANVTIQRSAIHSGPVQRGEATVTVQRPAVSAPEPASPMQDTSPHQETAETAPEPPHQQLEAARSEARYLREQLHGRDPGDMGEVQRLLVDKRTLQTRVYSLMAELDDERREVRRLAALVRKLGGDPD